MTKVDILLQYSIFLNKLIFYCYNLHSFGLFSIVTIFMTYAYFYCYYLPGFSLFSFCAIFVILVYFPWLHASLLFLVTLLFFLLLQSS